MDKSFYIIIGISFVFSALVMVLVSVPLIRERVAMNKTYGVRIPKAFESEANWYTINKRGGRLLASCSIGVALAGVPFLSIKPAPAAWSFWTLILAPLWLLALVLWRLKSFAADLP